MTTAPDPHDEAKILADGPPATKPEPEPTCPNCDGPLTYDSGLFHCDGDDTAAGCGAWDPEDVR